MAPTAAMALNGVGVADNIGRAVPLAFLISGRPCSSSRGVHTALGALQPRRLGLRLQRRHAGAAGRFFSGWALLGTYLAFTVASSAEVGLFLAQFANGTGHLERERVDLDLARRGNRDRHPRLQRHQADDAHPDQHGGRVGAADHGADGGHLRAPGDGVGAGRGWVHARACSRSRAGRRAPRSASGSCSAFLSFAGFEGAAALGEETNEPRRHIPRAIRNAVIGAGIFYLFCMLAQTWGFGTGRAGVAAFGSSSSPLGDLGKSYIGSWMGDAINLGAAVSGFASALATATGASPDPVRYGPRRVRHATARVVVAIAPGRRRWRWPVS